ncbi:MAG: ROK family protein [Clostridia bacterium]|nr:ROK family protein [Clostridia bacterium]
MLGALEAGGTKMICSTGDENGKVSSRVSIPTTTPEETIPRIIAFFREANVEALGIGSFGPVDLDETSSSYGFITTTPKEGWRNYPLRGALLRALSVPVGFDTDVNASALGEYTFGAAKGVSSCVYVTVGTGIGGGLIVEGNLVHGLVHPELGHFWLRPHPSDPAPHGFCPYHDGCVEGFSTGPAIEKRWGQRAETLPADHPAWMLESYYLAQMCVTVITCLSPKKIILGGGVMRQTHLFAPIRRQVLEMLAGYVQHPAILTGIEDYIVPPGLGENSGVTGALLLAARASA